MLGERSRERPETRPDFYHPIVPARGDSGDDGFHYRVVGETCSLVMLESEADYKRFPELETLKR